jgi:acetyl-CoA synthetase
VLTVDSYQRGGRRVELLEKVVAAGSPPAIVIAEGRPPLRPGDARWDDVLGPDELLAPHVAEPDEVVNVLFSSGTTGTPKAIPWTHLTPIKCAMDGRFHQDIHAGEVVAWPTNIGWMMGPWLIFATLINRATMALHEGAPTTPSFARFVEQARVGMLGVVPSLVRAWRSSGALADADWGGVRVFSSTGEASSREDYLWLMSRAGYRAPVIEYCGGTEIGGGYITGTVVQPATPATFTTPALGLDFVILDESGRPSPEGELFLVPPSIGLSQTLLNADHEAIYHSGCPTGPDGQALRRHGDQVEALPGGGWRAAGRADDAMNLGGIKVGTKEIEAVVDAHPEVYESAAVGVALRGEGAEVLVVFAVPRGDVEQQALLVELRSAISQELNPLFRLHDLVLLEALPRTASNKIVRRELRRRYREGGSS